MLVTSTAALESLQPGLTLTQGPEPSAPTLEQTAWLLPLYNTNHPYQFKPLLSKGLSHCTRLSPVVVLPVPESFF